MIVYKYDITHGEVIVPAGKILLAGRQDSRVYCWVLIDEALPNRRVRIFATGEEITNDWTHVHSFQDGAYVWHVFDNLR